MSVFYRRRLMLLFAAVAITMIAVPCASYAQFGGLANMAKGKAIEALTDGAMKELEKKFKETVAKEPISETAKANIVKKLTEMSRPIVKKFIDGASSGKLPNPAELAQTVLKEIAPRIPELVAAAKAEDGGGSAAAQKPSAAQQTAQTQEPVPAKAVKPAGSGGGAAPAQEVSGEEAVNPELLAALAGTHPPVKAKEELVSEQVTAPVQAAQAIPEAAAPVQTVQETAPVQTTHDAAIPPIEPAPPKTDEKPNIAAYVLGAKDPGLNKAMAVRLVAALANSGRYQASEDYMEFFDQAVEEQKRGAASMDVEQIRKLGERFGVDYVCVTQIVTVFGNYRAFAYILRVQTAKSAARGASDVPLKTLADLTAAAEQIVESMFKKGQQEAVQPPVATPPPTPPREPPAPPCLPSASKEPAAGESVAAASERKPQSGFTLGYGFSGDANIIQFGGVYIYPIAEKIISLVAESDFRFGELNNSFDKYSETISYYGVDIPVMCKFEKGSVFAETGVFADVLFSKKEGWVSDKVWMANFGIALGGGVAFSKGHTQYFYRYNYGNAYYSHTFGIKQLF